MTRAPHLPPPDVPTFLLTIWEQLGITYQPDQDDTGLHLGDDHLGTIATIKSRRVYVVQLGQARMKALPHGDLPEDPVELADVERWRDEETRRTGEIPPAPSNQQVERIRAEAARRRQPALVAAGEEPYSKPLLSEDRQADMVAELEARWPGRGWKIDHERGPNLPRLSWDEGPTGPAVRTFTARAFTTYARRIS